MKVTGVVCDQCAGPIPSGHRTLYAMMVVADGEREASKELKDVCGEACAHKALSALLTEVRGQ